MRGGAQNTGVVKKIRNFKPITRYISQTIEDSYSYYRRRIGTVYPSFQMVLFSMTLSYMSYNHMSYNHA